MGYENSEPFPQFARGVSLRGTRGGEKALRVTYWGMFGELSRAPLAALVAAGVQVCGVFVPGTPVAARQIPIVEPLPPPTDGADPLEIVNPFLEQTCVHEAWRHGIPVYRLNGLPPQESRAFLETLHPDLACVSCFPHRIPQTILSVPPLGFLNVHPSLLPRFRGPAPLFWTFREGAPAGVTVHFMDVDLDTGDIANQAELSLADGVSGREAEYLCALLGGRLLVETVLKLTAGAEARTPQGEGGCSTPWPRPHDFEISPSWPARRAFNFMRGTDSWGQPYPIHIGGRLVQLGRALEYTTDAELGAAFQWNGPHLQIQFNPGVLTATAVGAAECDSAQA